jgi:protein-disulfide isomerase
MVDQGPPTYLPSWRDLIANGVLEGDSTAVVKLVEFSDLECPVCRQFERNVRSVRAKYPKEVSVVFVHFPLPQHRFARPAARAAECADRSGRFAEFVALAYDKQDSLGLKPWTSYALEAGVRNTARFARCVADASPVPRIDDGVALAHRMGVRGTPTVIVNGWRFSSPPAEAELIRTVAALIAGDRPFAFGGSSNGR